MRSAFRSALRCSLRVLRAMVAGFVLPLRLVWIAVVIACLRGCVRRAFVSGLLRYVVVSLLNNSPRLHPAAVLRSWRFCHFALPFLDGCFRVSALPLRLTLLFHSAFSAFPDSVGFTRFRFLFSYVSVAFAPFTLIHSVWCRYALVDYLRCFLVVLSVFVLIRCGYVVLPHFVHRSLPSVDLI